MKTWTWAEIKERVYTDKTLFDEDFITEAELLGYANEAIDEAEQIFKKIYDNYFQSEVYIELVSGQSIYDLPENIYGYKILLVQYDDGSKKYPIRRIRDLKEIPYITNSDCYCYRITNNATEGPKFKLYPASMENSTSNVTIFFLRNANELVNDESTLDIPEAAQFIIQYIKDAVSNKEKGPMIEAPDSPQLIRKRQFMIEALTEMVPDGDNLIEPDLSFYEDFLGGEL